MIIAGTLQPCVSTGHVLDRVISPGIIVGMRSSCTNIGIYTLPALHPVSNLKMLTCITCLLRRQTCMHMRSYPTCYIHCPLLSFYIPIPPRPRSLHGRVHIHLRPIPPSPLNRIRTHLHARPDPVRTTSMHRENLSSVLASHPRPNPLSLPLPFPIHHLLPNISFLCNVRTLVPDHPSLNATSFATNSPKPNIRPFTKGSRRLIAAPRTRPQSVGGL
jgi:hypothetical protein